MSKEGEGKQKCAAGDIYILVYLQFPWGNLRGIYVVPIYNFTAERAKASGETVSLFCHGLAEIEPFPSSFIFFPFCAAAEVFFRCCAHTF